MKHSRKTFISVLLFIAASLLSPAISQAGTLTSAFDQITTQNPDPQTPCFNKPNLDKRDGFEESEHKRKIRQKLLKNYQLILMHNQYSIKHELALNSSFEL